MSGQRCGPPVKGRTPTCRNRCARNTTCSAHRDISASAYYGAHTSRALAARALAHCVSAAADQAVLDGAAALALTIIDAASTEPVCDRLLRAYPPV